jgi:hypothetical protein
MTLNIRAVVRDIYNPETFYLAGTFVFGAPFFALCTVILLSQKRLRWFNPEAVRVSQSSGELWLLPDRRAANVFMVIGVVIGLGFGWVAVTALEWQSQLGRGWDHGWSLRAVQAIVVLLITVCSLPWVVRNLFKAQGISLRPGGIMLRAGRMRPVMLSWEQFAKVGVQARHYAGMVNPELVIRTFDGATYRLRSERIGSDPNIVAAIVRFYLDHPEQRDALSDPVEALRRVEQAEPSTRVGGGR